MSESKTVIYSPDSGMAGGNGMMAMLAPLLQQKGIDPNLLVAMNGKNGGNGWGNGSDFLWIIFLFFLFPLLGRGGWGNGFGGGNEGGCPSGAGLANLINNDNGRELLMSAIQGNGQAINNLATNLNCSVGQIQQAINGVSAKVAEVGCQVGMSSQQIINSIQAGNCQIANQMAQCCCDVKGAIQQQGYENRIATINQTDDLKSNANTQFNILGAKIDAQTQIINDKFCQLEMREMQNKIDTLRAEKSALELSASQQAQTANIVNQLRTPAPIPAYCVPNPNCCYGYPFVNAYATGYAAGEGCGCGC
ncbi:outer capsid protein/viral fiber [Bacteroides phage C3_41T2LP]|jgi:hypothetical protein|nr:outer capsid protein/viral fiber [Bacteroides phage C3_41T2LP]